MRTRSRFLRIQALESRLAPAVFTWDGGGSDNNWTTPANWAGDIAPGTLGVDVLVFPAGAARLTNTNNYPANTVFGRMDLTGPGYQIGGNAVAFDDGINATSPTPIDPVNFPQLSFPLAFNVAGTSTDFAGDANMGVVFNGPIAFPNNSSVLVSGRYTINGLISGHGGVGTTSDDADLVLTANNTYSQFTSVRGGSMRIEGDQNTNHTVDVENFNNDISTLRGTGRVGSIGVGNLGVVNPGTAGPGTLRALQLFVTGTGSYVVDIAGTAAGQYDQIRVSSGVQLTGNLRLNVSGTPISPGPNLRIIDNTSATAISGTFAGLPEGAIVATADRVRYRITYVGGDGNDVELLTSPGPDTFTWDGGSTASDLWSDAANWAGDVAPTAGSILVFPAGAARPANTNDFAAGTAFDSLVVGNGYSLGGSGIALTNSLTGTPTTPTAAGNATVNFGVALNASQEFVADGPAFNLTFTGPVNMNGFGLTTGGAGSVIVDGTVNGSGGIVVRSGSLTLRGNNSYTGLTNVQDGTLTVGSSNALGATGAGNETRLPIGSELVVITFNGLNPVIPESLIIGAPASGLIGITAPATNTGPVTLSGPLSVASTANVLGAGTFPLIIAGPLTGAGTLSMGNTIIAATSASPGFTGNLNGTFQINGSAPSANATAGGVISGAGVVGPILAVGLGTISPGVNGVGTLGTGSLTISEATGGIIPVAAGRFAVDLTATGADRVNATGTVRLGGDLVLTVALGFVPVKGASFRIIDNDGTDAVINPFFGPFGDGAVVTTIGGIRMRVTFTGGDGNDVELVATAGDSRIVVGAGAGGGPIVRVYADGANLVREFNAYDPNFRGGVRVAQGDFTGDGIDDIVTAPGPGGGPHIRVWDGATGNLLNEFFAFPADFTGGVNIAVGDVNNRGQLDIVTAPDFGGVPLVLTYTRTGASAGGGFYAYDIGFRGGVTVAAGDVTGDGIDDIVTGAGRTGGSHVEVFVGTGGAMVGQFFAFDGFFGGVNVAVVNNSVAVTPMAGGGPIVRVFSGAGTLLSQFNTYPSDFRGGITVAGRDVDGDNIEDVVTGPGPGGGPLVLGFTTSGRQKRAFFAFDPAFLGGIFVG